MEKFLIGLDLDGTLLNKQGKVSDYTKSVLRELQRMGHLVVITTGRSVRISEHIYKEIGLKGPMINSNGAHIHKPTHKSWKGNAKQGISISMAREILTLQKENQIGWIGIENEQQVMLTTYDIPQTDYFPLDRNTMKLIQTPDELTINPVGFAWFTTLDEQQLVKEQVLNHIDGTLDVRTWGGFLPCLEITPAGINKATGLQKLLDYYHLTSNQLIAFGDEHNDYEMLQVAKYGIAMKNATDNIKSIATDITQYDNNEDGVAHYLVEFFNLSKNKELFK